MHPNWCGRTYAECIADDGHPHCGVHAYVSAVQPVIDSLEGVEVTETTNQDDAHGQAVYDRLRPGTNLVGDFESNPDDDVSEFFVVTGEQYGQDSNDETSMYSNVQIWYLKSSEDPVLAADAKSLPGVISVGRDPYLSWWGEGFKSEKYGGTFPLYTFIYVEQISDEASISHVFGIKDGIPYEVPFENVVISEIHEEFDANSDYNHGYSIIGSVLVSSNPPQYQHYFFEFDPEAYVFRTTEAVD